MITQSWEPGKDWEEPGRALPVGFMDRGLITPSQAAHRAMCQVAAGHGRAGQGLLGKRQGGRAPRAAQEYLLGGTKHFPGLFCSLTNWSVEIWYSKDDVVIWRSSGFARQAQWDGQMAHAGIRVSANPSSLAGGSGA